MIDKYYPLTYDNPEVKYELTGKDLMSEGIEITINDKPKAAIMLYKVK